MEDIADFALIIIFAAACGWLVGPIIMVLAAGGGFAIKAWRTR